MSVDEQSRIKLDIERLVDAWEEMASDDNVAVRMKDDPETLWREKGISEETIQILKRGDLKELRQRFTFPGEERGRIVFLVVFPFPWGKDKQ